MQTIRTIHLSGRNCQCGALRADRNRRCEKCQARSGWYRHNCRHPRRAVSRSSRASVRNDAGTPPRGQHSREES